MEFKYYLTYITLRPKFITSLEQQLIESSYQTAVDKATSHAEIMIQETNLKRNNPKTPINFSR